MNSPIRILHIGLTGNLGGIEVFVMNLYKKIDRNKIQFDFIDYDGIYYDSLIKKMGGEIIKIPTRRSNFIENRKQIKQIINSGKYKAIHCHQLSVANIDFIKIALKNNNTNIILHSHMEMNLRHFRSEILHRYHRMWLKNKDITRFACSPEASKWIHGNVDTTIFKNAIDVQKFKYDIKTSMDYRELFCIKDKLVIGHVGRFAYQKNHEFLIDIFYEIYKQNSNSVLLLVGGEGGLQDDIIQKINNYNLKDAVIMTGIREDVHHIMQAMDIFIFPSRWEGLGIALIEAQAAGLLCFGSDVIPQEAKVTDLLHFLSLEHDEKVWANIILNKWKNHIKKDVSNQLIEKGYDINNTSKWIEKFYLELK